METATFNVESVAAQFWQIGRNLGPARAVEYLRDMDMSHADRMAVESYAATLGNGPIPDPEPAPRVTVRVESLNPRVYAEPIAAARRAAGEERRASRAARRAARVERGAAIIGANRELFAVAAAVAHELNARRGRRSAYALATPTGVYVVTDSTARVVEDSDNPMCGAVVDSDPAILADMSRGHVYPVAHTRARAERMAAKRAKLAADAESAAEHAAAVAAVRAKNHDMSAAERHAARMARRLAEWTPGGEPVAVEAATAADWLAALDRHAGARVRDIRRTRKPIAAPQRTGLSTPRDATPEALNEWVSRGLSYADARDLVAWADAAPTAGAARVRRADARKRLDNGKPWQPRGYHAATARMGNSQRRK